MIRLNGLFGALTLLTSFLVPTAAVADILEGRWTTSFFDTKVNKARIEQTFDDGVSTLRIWIQTSLPYQTRGFFTERIAHYQIIGPSSTIDGAFNVDVIVDKVTLMFMDPDSIILTQSEGTLLSCGLRDWQVGVARDVTGLQCDKELFAASGSVERLTFKIDGSTLYWGPYWGPDAIVAQPAGSTATRTTVLDMDHPLTRP